MAGPGRPKKSSAVVPQPRKVYDSEIEPDEMSQRFPPARSPEAREAQLASLAYDVVEERMRKGTASSQELVYFLRVGSTREKKELEQLKQTTMLTEAKVKEIANAEEMKKLYMEAMDAMRGYAGHGEGADDHPDIF